MVSEIGEPRIENRDAVQTMGIRVTTPFRGMFAVVDQLRKELNTWLMAREIEPEGHYFLRYYVIDMDGDMDIEFGIQVATPLPGDERVRPGEIPAGRYGFLVYHRYALRGNKALLNWAHQQGLQWDRWASPQGDNFRCRCETYLTDPRVEHRKSKWDVDLAIKLAD